jgi:hypothetical protein
LRYVAPYDVNGLGVVGAYAPVRPVVGRGAGLNVRAVVMGVENELKDPWY